MGGAFLTEEPAAQQTTLVDPATQREIGRTPRADEALTDRAVAAAKDGLPAWAGLTPREHAEILLGIADRIEEHAERLARIESLDTGKPREVAADDVSMAADLFRFCAGAARSFTEAGSAEYVQGHTSVILREPVGVVGAIVPWNYPLLMGVWKVDPILAAGNTLVLKPAEQTPLSLLALAGITADLLPAGVLNLVMGLGRTVGHRLSEHPDVALVALTGSVGSCQAVATTAGATTKRVHLELGGKAPVVILADADLEQAAQILRTAAFWNSGQGAVRARACWCTSPWRSASPSRRC